MEELLVYAWYVLLIAGILTVAAFLIKLVYDKVISQISFKLLGHIIEAEEIALRNKESIERGLYDYDKVRRLEKKTREIVKEKEKLYNKKTRK